MASPSAAWRPWPTWSGPVGLAETNSTSTFSPVAGWRPYASPATSTSRTTCCLAATFNRMLRKPGPASSTSCTHRPKAGVASRAVLSSAASSRGLRASGLASCIAAVLAKSPCAGTLGDSNAALAPAPGEKDSRVFASAERSSCLTNCMFEFYSGAKPKVSVLDIPRHSDLARPQPPT